MTISSEARTVFEEIGADHQDAGLAAKAIAQQIIDDSASEEQPLTGMVYDVWGLYNEGDPRCRFTAPYKNRDIVFSGLFRRADGDDDFAVRRRVFSQSEMAELIQKNATSPL
jgi:hypothetical protein